jgi:hypothetical protein
MPAPTRQSIIRGGGSLQFKGQTWIDKEGINAAVESARTALTGSDFGTIDTFVTDRRAKISLTPIGRLTAARLAILYPYATTAKGTSLYGDPNIARIAVTGAGTTAVNGIYTQSGTANGKPKYVLDGAVDAEAIYFDLINWMICDDEGNGVYIAAGTTALPPATGWTAVEGFGLAPVPSFENLDWPVIIHSRAGKKLTFFNAAITGLPDLMLGADRTALGAMELTALKADGREWTDSDAFYALESVAYSEPTIDRTEIKRVPYVGAWGSTFTGLVAKDAWTVNFALQTNDETVADYGTLDQTFQDLTVTAKCRPVNLGEELLAQMRLQGAGANIGTSESVGKNLVIVGQGGLTVTLFDAMFIEGPLVWNGVELRAGEIGFQASRTNGTGALFSVALTA